MHQENRKSPLTYAMSMSSVNNDIDDRACAEVMRRFCLATRQEAVNFALRKLAAEAALIVEAHNLRGSGWDGDLNAWRST